MALEIKTEEMRERLRAYFRPNNHIDASLLILDIIILMKWSKIPRNEFIKEFRYQWDRVHFDPTFKAN